MKKILTLLLLVMLSGTLKAQTKEETISWLKDKLEECLQGWATPATNIKVISVNECEFTVSFTISGDDYVSTIPTANMSDNLINDTYEGQISFDYEAVKYNKVADKEVKYNKICFLGIGNREENIRERIFKAFKYLATFCPAKKTETF